MSTTTTDAPERQHGVLRRLYYGETDAQIIPRWRLWFALSAAVILVGLVALGVRGLNLGIDFTGGNQWELASGGASPSEVEDAIEDLGFSEVRVQEVGEGDLRVRTAAIEGSDEERIERNAEVVDALTEITGVAEDDMLITEVGPSWGEEISEKALRALVFFLIAILIYITIRFELRMAIATIIALLHDLLVVVGMYALFQLPVTPATVVAILTILGFSIYDGVVVFDRVDENTRLVTASGRLTYSAMVNRSINQVLMRSLNTQITSVIPIISVLVVGSLALGAATLQEFGIALFIGQVSGAYSSIFIASPALALLKEREPRYRAIRHRIEERTARGSGGRDDDAPDADDDAPASDGEPGPRAAAASRPGTASRPAKGSGAGAARKKGGGGPAARGTSRTHPPRPRKKGKRR